jgi:hypothetical protein
VAAVVEDAVRAFEEAGARVEQVNLGIERDQRELSDLWCRLIIPINIATFENFKRQGTDLLADHRDDFPPEYLRWIDEGYELRTADLMRDEELRSEIYDAIQNALADHELLITPTLACLPVQNAADGNTKGPTEINGVEVDPLIGWCLTYPVNFSGHPAASIPAGMAEGLPVGMQIIGRRYADADVLAASATLRTPTPLARPVRPGASELTRRPRHVRSELDTAPVRSLGSRPGTAARIADRAARWVSRIAIARLATGSARTGLLLFVQLDSQRRLDRTAADGWFHRQRAVSSSAPAHRPERQSGRRGLRRRLVHNRSIAHESRRRCEPAAVTAWVTKRVSAPRGPVSLSVVVTEEARERAAVGAVAAVGRAP